MSLNANLDLIMRGFPSPPPPDFLMTSSVRLGRIQQPPNKFSQADRQTLRVKETQSHLNRCQLSKVNHPGGYIK